MIWSPLSHRDRQDRTPYCVSADRLTRNAFRKFMVDHPDKYDYSRAKVGACPLPSPPGDPRAKLSFPTCAMAPGSVGDAACPQVPGPLTQEMEAKKLEKKRAQKAQRKQREQAQREEQRRWEQEQENKQRFAALSDREKVRIGKGISPERAVVMWWAQQLAGPAGAELSLFPRGPWLLSGGWLHSCRTPARLLPTSGNHPSSMALKTNSPMSAELFPACLAPVLISSPKLFLST